MGTKLGVLSIQVLNGAVLWFVSAFALQARWPVFIVGSFGVIAFTVIAFRVIAIDRPSTAMSISVGTLPALLIIMQIVMATIGAPLAILPAMVILVSGFTWVARHARQRLNASGAATSDVPLLLESRFSIGEWLTLLSASMLAGLLCLVLYQHIYA